MQPETIPAKDGSFRFLRRRGDGTWFYPLYYETLAELQEIVGIIQVSDIRIETKRDGQWIPFGELDGVTEFDRSTAADPNPGGCSGPGMHSIWTEREPDLR